LNSEDIKKVEESKKLLEQLNTEAKEKVEALKRKEEAVKLALK